MRKTYSRPAAIIFTVIAVALCLVYSLGFLFPGTSGESVIPGIPAIPSIPELFYTKSPVEIIPPEDLTVPDLVVLGARDEVVRRVRYDASYMSIDYPGGDVPEGIGVCTDVVIRAFRNAGIDLQVLIHEDMRDNFSLYPQSYGLTSTDRNIDHRRARNQMRFFERFGEPLTLQVAGSLTEWQWGDIVYWRFPDGQLHAGVISDKKNRRGIPLVIHNAWQAVEEDALMRWEIIGHFRYQ